MELNQSIKIINNFFNITYVHNEGAAFSILTGQRYVLIFIGVISLYMFFKYLDTFKENKRNIITFSLLIGGVIGNLFDRVVYGHVIDFLDFKIFGYNYPIFNVADIFIFFAVIFLIVAIIKGEDYGSSSRKRRKIR